MVLGNERCEVADKKEGWMITCDKYMNGSTRKHQDVESTNINSSEDHDSCVS